MAEWGFNPSTVSAAGTVVSALALVVAIVGAFLAYRQGRRDRNLQAFMGLSADIRQRWEREWDALLNDEIPKLNLRDRHTGDVGRRVDYMLNWLDWMGLMLKMNLIDRELLFGSIGPTIMAILHETAYKIQCDVDDPDKGEKWWANILYLASLPEIRVNIASEAEALRQKWGEPPRATDPS